MKPQPKPRWFKISEVQLTALRKGWTHTSLDDEKGILQSVWDDQMIDSGCTSHTATEREKSLDEYYIDFEENGGEYTGHLRICTPDKLEFDGDRTLKTNGVIIKLDEKIELVEKQEPRTAPADNQ